MPCSRSLPRAACGSGVDSAYSRAFARPRVECSSSRVAMYDGHMTPVDSLRHSPMFMQRSAAPRIPPGASKRSRVTSAGRGGVRRIAQVVGHRGRVHDLPWVHPVLRIEESFGLLHGRVQLVAEDTGG